MKHNAPKKREIGKSSKRCKLCLRTGGHIAMYNIHLCRQCFRLNAKNIGFKKYS